MGENSNICILRHKVKNFRIFGKKNLACLSKLHSTCPKDHFHEKNCFRKKIIIFSSDFCWIFSKISQNSYRSVVKTCIVHVNLNILTKFFSSRPDIVSHFLGIGDNLRENWWQSLFSLSDNEPLFSWEFWCKSSCRVGETPVYKSA